MPTFWYVQKRGEKSEPVAFGELVELVRAGEVTEDDWVRPAWLSEWQRADSVPGLFYMARRRLREREQAPVANQETAATGQEPGAVRPDSSGVDEQRAQEGQLLAEIAAEAAEALPEPEVEADERRLSWGQWLFLRLFPDRLLCWLFRTEPTASARAGPASGSVEGTGAAGSRAGHPVEGPDRLEESATIGTGPVADEVLERTGTAQAPEVLSGAGGREAEASPVAATPGVGSNAEERFSVSEAELAEAAGHANQTPIAGTGSRPLDSEHPAEAEPRSEEMREVMGEALRRLEARRAAAARRQRRRRLGAGRLFGFVALVLGGAVAVLWAPIRWAETVAAGMGRIAWLERWGEAASGWIARHRWFRQAFRIFCALAAANLMAIFLLDWSEKEAMRFPGSEQAANVRSLPVVGECSPTEYWFFFADLVLAAGMIAYAVAAWLEMHAED